MTNEHLDDQVISDYLCTARDIASAASNDNTSPPSPCDAVSFALGFTTVAAHLGAPSAPPYVPPCEPDASAVCPP
jgi:hypothetical protein